jgi:integrase/recombinase XerD
MSKPIKDKFIEHMELFGLTKETRRGYVSGVRCLAKHYNQSPEKLRNDQVRDYFRHLLLEKKLAWTSCKTYLSGITYFYRHICNREVDDRFGLPPRPRGRKLPAVLSMEEVSRLLGCIDNLKTGYCSRPSTAPVSGSGKPFDSNPIISKAIRREW